MMNCGNCLYQGDRNADKNGNCSVFCLVKGNWFKEDFTCNHFREHADISKEIRSSLASEVRLEEAESRRLKRIIGYNWLVILATFGLSFVLFLAAIKFFDSFIF